MPYRTKSGSHYHETYGCHGATIPCDAAGLEPCSDCCGAGASGDPDPSSATAGGTPVGASATEGQGEFSLGSASSQLGQDDLTSPEPSPRQATEIAEAGWDGMRNGQEMPAPSDDIDFDRLFADAFGQATTDSPSVATPSERIRSLFELDVTDPRYDDSILVLADIADGRRPSDRREVERAISDGVAMTHDLVDAVRSEDDPERRERLLQVMGTLANDGVLKGALSSLSEFPAGWHQTHSLAAACNQHDMFYVTKALTDRSDRRRMSVDDFEDGVMPMLDALSTLAESHFRELPRVVRTVRRFPDGPDGDRAWGTQESALVTKDDVDDPHVLSLMDRDEVRGRAQDEAYHRGVPGYWVLGADPRAERDEYVQSVQWMVSHMPRWNRRRGRQAIRDYDENVAPIRNWLARHDVAERLRSADGVEAIDLLA